MKVVEVLVLRMITTVAAVMTKMITIIKQQRR